MTVAVYDATRDYTDAIRQNNPKRRVGQWDTSLSWRVHIRLLRLDKTHTLCF